MGPSVRTVVGTVSNAFQRESTETAQSHFIEFTFRLSDELVTGEIYLLFNLSCVQLSPALPTLYKICLTCLRNLMNALIQPPEVGQLIYL